MATTVYLPPHYGGVSPGEAVGQGLGTAVGVFLARQQKQEKVKQMQQYIEALKQAPDRRTALEMGSSIPFEDTKDIATFYRLVDEFHPERVDPVETVEVFDSSTGEATKRFLPKSKLPALNEPAVVESMFGTGKTLTKPQVEDFYTPDGKRIGRAPLAKRPEGALTLKELELERKSRAETRAETAAERNDRRLELLENSANLAQDRFAQQQAVQGKLVQLWDSMIRRNDRQAAGGGSEAMRTELSALKSATSLWTNSFNAKKVVGQDGAVSIDFEGDPNKMKQWARGVELLPEALAKYKNPNKAFAEVQRAVAAEFPDAPKPEPLPSGGGKSDKGGVSSFIENLFGSVSEKVKEKTPGAKSTGKPAEKKGAAPTKGETKPIRKAAPKVGDVVKGYRFKGGDPSKPSSWEKVK